MKKYLPKTLGAVAVAVIFGAAGAGLAPAQRTTEILRRMDEHYKRLQTLQADIRMEKFNRQIAETDVSTGRVKYIPKTAKNVMYVRVDWLKPLEESMSVIGDAYTIYRPRLKQVYQGRTDEAKNNAKAGNALAFMGMSRRELKENYTHRDLGNETLPGGVETVHLELVPKAATSYQAAHLWVNKDGLPVMVRIVERNDDTTTVVLSNAVTNDPVKGSDFVINFPKSIKPIR